MEKTLHILNQLERDGLINRYAIAGGIAVLFYAEPVLTYDLDIFCLIPTPLGDLVSLSPLHEKLKGMGYGTEAEHVMIEGMPVQFIPSYNPLVDEALAEAVEVRYREATTRVVRVEHLLAIMLQTYRPKDRERMLLLLDEAKIDMPYVQAILARHDLVEKWEAFRRRYAEE